MASNSSTDTTIIVYPPQTEINLRLLTALAHEETSHLEFHCPCPLSKKINEQLRWHADMRREDEWMRKMQQREGIARAKRAANREAKRQEAQAKQEALQVEKSDNAEQQAEEEPINTELQAEGDAPDGETA